MAKTGTRRPLNIGVDVRIIDWPEFRQLEEQGHGIHPMTLIVDEIILGPLCHRMSIHERNWLSDAIEEAQRLKYPAKKGKE